MLGKTTTIETAGVETSSAPISTQDAEIVTTLNLETSPMTTEDTAESTTDEGNTQNGG